MTNLEEFIEITNEYDDKLYAIFIREIEEAKRKSLENNLNAIDTHIYINKKIESLYANLSIALGLIPNELSYNDNIPVSETLLEKICNYIEPIVKEATEEIKQKAEYVLEATTIEELQDRYTDLLNIMNDLSSNHLEFVYEGMELKRK